MKLRVPYYRQDKSYTCGPASLQAVLKFLGDFKSEEWLTAHLHTDKEMGTTHAAMIALATELGFHHHSHARAKLREIKYFLKQDLPVIVNYIEPADNEGHYAVLTGLSRWQVSLNDPWLGKNFELPIREFKKRWHNSRNNSQGWLLVLSDMPLGCGGRGFWSWLT